MLNFTLPSIENRAIWGLRTARWIGRAKWVEKSLFSLLRATLATLYYNNIILNQNINSWWQNIYTWTNFVPSYFYPIYRPLRDIYKKINFVKLSLLWGGSYMKFLNWISLHSVETLDQTQFRKNSFALILSSWIFLFTFIAWIKSEVHKSIFWGVSIFWL